MRFYFLRSFTAPQHTRFILPPIHPDKIIAALRGRYFSFVGNVPWKFHEPSERDTGFPAHAAANQGQELRSAWTAIIIYEQWPFTCFCVLTIRKQLSKTCFERSGRGQESSRGHKFSILENSCPFGTASCWGVPAPNPAGTSTANWNLYNYSSNFPYFTGFPACSLVKWYVVSLIFALMR